MTLFLCLLAVLTWPGILRRAVSLDWQMGNMRPVAEGIAASCGLLAAVSLVLRKRINALFSKWFPTRKHFLFACIAASLSLVVSLVALELGLRMLRFPFTEELTVSENALAQFDPELGWSYIPNHTAVQEFGSEKRKVAMYFDDLGCRVRATGLYHDPSAPSVLFVGDSFTFGHGLPYEETFIGQLGAKPGFPYQVVSLGVQGYGTDQSLLLLKRQFRKFNTKVVVYTFIEQDMDRNRVEDLRLFHRFSRFLGTKPLFGLRPDSTLYLKERPAKYQEISYSHLWACVRIALLRFGPKTTANLTRALVREMQRFAESNAAKLIVVDWKQPIGKHAAASSIFQGMGLRLIETAANPPAGWDSWIIPGDGHPDARANLYVAQLLAEELRRTANRTADVPARRSDAGSDVPPWQTR